MRHASPPTTAMNLKDFNLPKTPVALMREAVQVINRLTAPMLEGKTGVNVLEFQVRDLVILHLAGRWLTDSMDAFEAFAAPGDPDAQKAVADLLKQFNPKGDTTK